MNSTVKGIGVEVPKEVITVTETLKNKGFEAYIVGGCVRDLLIGRTPKDWDVTTNATPEEIITAFPKTFYENTFGTVGVVDENTTDESLKVIEVTPYRLETGYSDFRRPDEVKFSKHLKDDLERRDFTINALAADVANGKIANILDFHNGQKDLKDKTLRAVGDANERFHEDALRSLRAVRIATELGFMINKETEEAIVTHVTLLKHISWERIRDEFSRILMSDYPANGIFLAQRLGIIKEIVPELEAGIGVEQNQAHAFDVWTHLLKSLQHAADKKWPLDIRLAALFHDISKPETRRFSHETQQWTFYGHEVVGSRVTQKILDRLKYPRKTIDKVVKLVRWHMFFSDTESISLSAVRRMIANVGTENIWDLMNVRICDRIGTGRPKENPYRLRKYQSMIEEALHDPVSVAMLKIDGKKIMEVTKITPGPKIGQVLNALLEDVLENPSHNTAEYLENTAKKLIELSDEELKKRGEAGKELREAEEEKNLEEIRKKYHVS
ncbi:MAG: HD domain-containing protein [Candidatus Taylorbacteria bacterium]|nr:HD domain-containing protein [Candidatus Taylorbacteria bacterium]